MIKILNVLNYSSHTLHCEMGYPGSITFLILRIFDKMMPQEIVEGFDYSINSNYFLFISVLNILIFRNYKSHANSFKIRCELFYLTLN